MKWCGTLHQFVNPPRSGALQRGWHSELGASAGGLNASKFNVPCAMQRWETLVLPSLASAAELCAPDCEGG
jgi:hypothetical protein